MVGSGGEWSDASRSSSSVGLLAVEVTGMIFSRAFKWVDEPTAADGTAAFTLRLGRIIVGIVNGLSATVEWAVRR